MPPMTTIKQHVDHDLERERRVGPVVAQPEREQHAGERGEQGRDDAGDRAVDDGAVADRLGAEVVLADRLQDAAERRVDDAQQQQHQHQRGDEEQVVGEQPAVDRGAEEGLGGVLGAGPQGLRHLEGEAVLAAGEVGELRGQRREGGGDRERDHGEEDRPHAQAEQADQRASSATETHDRRRRCRAASAGQPGPSRVAARSRRRRRRCRRTSCARS